MSIFNTPPVEKLKAESAERKVTSEVLDLLAEMMLEDDAMPEKSKTGLRLLVKIKKFDKTLQEKMQTLCDPDNNDVEKVQEKRLEATQLLEKLEKLLSEFDPGVTPPSSETVNKSTIEIKVIKL